ncbi:MAG: putative Zn-dependent protease [Hyphomicrobiaceae bacterium]
MNPDRRRSVRIVLYNLALLTLSVSVAFAPSIVHAQLAQEKELGEEFVKAARRGFPMTTDYELESLVDDLGGRIVATLKDNNFDYEFFVVRADDINAFAVPGGKVFVHSGLVARAESEDELASVLGHEVAHAHAHHIIRQQQKSAPINYASLLGIFLGIVHPLLGQAALAAGQAAQLRYQRDFEREADYLGVRYARDAGFDPGAMMHLLRKIYAEQQLNPTSIPPYFLSHPLSGERLTNLEAVLGRNEWDGEALPASMRLQRARAVARAVAQTREQVVPDYERQLALATPEERPQALELIGVMMTHGEDWMLAEGYLEQARDAGRSVDRELGRVYLRRGKFDEARPLLEAAVKASEGDWNALADLGTLDYQQGRFVDAQRRLEKSFELDPWRPEVVRSLGRTFGKAGNPGAGFYWFGRASEIQGDFEGALGYFRKAADQLSDDDPLATKANEKVETLTEELDGNPPIPKVGRRLSWPRAQELW